MQTLQQLWAFVLAGIPAFLALGIAIGAIGTTLEALGVWRKLPWLVAFGQKLEAIGADIPKLVGKLNPPSSGNGSGGLPSLTSVKPLDPPAPFPDPPAAAMIGLRFLLAVGSALLFALPSCSLFRSSAPLAPVAGCAPSSRDVLNDVGLILLQGGDYEAKLKELAGKYTESTIDCAVAALVAEWTKPTARADQEHVDGAARGRAHLAKAEQ